MVKTLYTNLNESHFFFNLLLKGRKKLSSLTLCARACVYASTNLIIFAFVNFLFAANESKILFSSESLDL